MSRPTATRRPLWCVLGSTLISQLGTQMCAIAVPWYVIDTTGDAAQAAYTAFAATLPLLFAGMVMGSLADRLGVRRFCILADTLAALCTVAIPVLHTTVGLPFPVMFVLLFMAGFCGLTSAYACRLLLAGAAGRSGWSAESANGAFFSAQRLTLLAGPVLAAVLLPFTTAAGLIAVDAATFGCSALLLVLAGNVGPVRSAPARSAQVAKNWRSGLDWLVRRPGLRLLALSSCLVNAVVRIVTLVLLPVYVADVAGEPRLLGPLVTAFGVGLLGGGLVTGRLAGRFGGAPVLVGAQTLILAGMGAVLAAPSPVAVGAALVVAGLGGGLIAPVAMSALDRAAPEELRVRVAGAWQWATALLGPFAVLAAGPAGELGDGAGRVVMIAGALTVTWALTFAARRTAFSDTGVVPSPVR